MKENNPTLEIVRSELPELQALFALSAKPGTDVSSLAKQEIEFLRMQCLTKPEILECIPATVVMAVKWVIKNNLSLDPNAGLVYVKTRSVKIKDPVKGTDVWSKVLEVQASVNGIISQSRQRGRILDIERPEVIKNTDGRVIGVNLEFQTPAFDANGKQSTRWRKISFDESDFYRWQKASHRENGRNKEDANANTLNYANALYTSYKGGIDPEFARAKAIRHGLTKMGSNQNEQIVRITYIEDIKHEEIIDKKFDEAATQDDHHGNGYHQDTPSQHNGIDHNRADEDPITIPNADQL